MLHFPNLTSLVKRNLRYQIYFQNFTRMNSFTNDHNQQQGFHGQHTEKEGKGQDSDSKCGKLVHWKKRVQAKFENEVNIKDDARTVEENTLSLPEWVFGKEKYMSSNVFLLYKLYKE